MVRRITGPAPEAAAAWQVAAENRAAAGLEASDARWVLAVLTTQSLEGGRAAVLGPERRQRLLRLATGLGLRAFDANLVIAIVQDAARAGEEPLGAGTESRLRLVRPPQPAARANTFPWMAAAAAVALAALLFRALLAWVGAA